MNEFAKGRLALFFEKLTAVFPGRLLFLGLQGSYRRGEQTPESDLDIVTILDRAEYADLAKYRAMLWELPGTPQPCGFLCGLAELKSWPRYDLFGLYYDTEPFYGSLSDFVDPPGPADALESIRIGAANLLPRGHPPEHLRPPHPRNWPWLPEGGKISGHRPAISPHRGL